MAPVQRFDRSELRKPTRTREGWLRADGYLTRIGVFEYRRGDGSVQREWRPPEEVFHQDALASFTLAPITREHPRGAVTADNWRDVSVGTVGELVKRDGEFMRAPLVFYDPKAIGDLEKRERTELSCGYTCDLEETPGVWRDDAGVEHRYDCIQRTIRGNHVALVTKGRAGPEVRVRLDAHDALDSSLSPGDGDGRQTPGGSSMVKFKVDGVEYDVSEQAKQALEREDGKREALAARAKADLEAEKKARADAEAKAAELEKRLAEAEEAKADAVAPEKMREAVKARVSLETAAAPILGKDAKLDAMDERAIKVAVCQKLIPGWKSDGKSDAAIEGAYETALLLKKTQPTPTERARGVVSAPTREDDPGDDPIAAARQKMVQDARNAWKPAATK
jgi:hypothetical protein